MNNPPLRDSAAYPSPPATPVACPFHDGPETLDLLLAELRHSDPSLIDLTLELRSAMTTQADADRCLHLLFTLRSALDGRHHLAFFRVRVWVRRRIVARVRAGRTSPWQLVTLPLDCARYDELVNRCLAALADGTHGWPTTAALEFAFGELPVFSDARAA
ncbi:MAG TPA: hypothetical protein VK163_00330 [Opitutaceae bacterium]|nr:hypothetical protein [Opitutaceae bacterium]